MRCTTMVVGETDMNKTNVEHNSQKLPNIALRNWTVCTRPFASALALLCVSQVAVMADSQFKVFRPSTRPVVAVRFTPTGNVIYADQEGTLTMWDPDRDRTLWSISFRRPARRNDYTSVTVDAMDLSFDGRMAAVAYLRSGVDRNLVDEKAGDPSRQKDGVWEPRIILIDTTDGTVKKEIAEVRDRIRSVVFASSGRYVFVTTAPPLAWALKNHTLPSSLTVELSIDTGRVLRSFSSIGWAAGARLSPDDKRFAVAAHQYVAKDTSFYELQCYDADTGELLNSSKFETTNVAAISFSADGSLMLVGRSVRDHLEVDLISKDGVEKVTYVIPSVRSLEVHAAAFISEQQKIVLAGGRLHFAGLGDTGDPRFKDQGGVIFVIDRKTGEKLKTYAFESVVTCLSLSRDGLRTAIGMNDGRIALTDAL
jgi:WD40 repeat protein